MTHTHTHVLHSGLCPEGSETEGAGDHTHKTIPQTGAGRGSKTLEPELPGSECGHVRGAVCHQPHSGCSAETLVPGVHSLPVRLHLHVLVLQFIYSPYIHVIICTCISTLYMCMCHMYINVCACRVIVPPTRLVDCSGLLKRGSVFEMVDYQRTLKRDLENSSNLLHKKWVYLSVHV